VYPDMWVDPDEDPRESDVPPIGELETLVGYLHAYRLTLQMKCADLDAEQMARRSVPPSDLSLLGIVRHMADGERHWFRQVLAGEDVPSMFRTDEDRDGAFSGALPDPRAVDEAWAAWRAEVDFAERFVAEAPSLDLTGKVTIDGGREIPLRRVLIHLIEEYARHCGHADLLRECIDGRIGQ
jgi:uncharacterized damage-inducible protein DinB